MRDIFVIRIDTIFFLSIALIGSLLLKKEYFPALIAFIITPNMNMSFSSFTIMFLMVYVFKNFNDIHIGKWILPLTILFLIELVSYYNGYFEIVEFFKFMSVMFLVMLIIHNNKYYSRHEDVIISFIIGIVVGFISVLIQTLKVYSLSDLFGMGKRIGTTDVLNVSVENTTSLNPNTVGMLAAIGISLLLVYWYDKQKVEGFKKSKISIWIFSFLLFMGFASLSRAFFLELFLIILLYIYFNRKNINNFIKILLMTIFLSMFALIVTYNLFPDLLIGILERFKVEDITSGRNDIFIMYHETFKNNPQWWFFGTGLQNYTVKAGLKQAIHNSIQQIYFTWGLVGLGVALVYFIDIFNSGLNLINKKERESIYLIPLIILLVATLSSRFFSSFYTILLLIPTHSGLCLQVTRDKTEEVI